MLDEHIEHFTTNALLKEGDLSADRIDVTADSGSVTLRGKVQSYSRKLKAVETVRQCEGVKEVVNQLKVVSKDTVPDLKIAKLINEAMAECTNVNEKSIRVDVKEGEVTLTGYASSATSKTQAEDIATGTDGVREINNLLVVNHDRVIANGELSCTISAAIRRTIGMENDEINIAVVDEMARLSGTVDAPWKQNVAEQTVRSFGIIKVCNEIVHMKTVKL